MKNNFYIYLTALLTSSTFVSAQHNAEFASQGATIKVQPGAIISIQGDMHQLGGLLSNDGFIEIQGNLYSDNTFQQRGTGTVRLENNDVNIGERQFISGSFAVRGGTAQIGINDGSFYNLELANTAGFVYLVGGGNVADVRNTVDFLPATASGTPSRNSIVTHNIGMTGAITYPANGASYSSTFGMMNPTAGNTNFMNNTIDLGGNTSTTDQGYVIGKLRRAVSPAGGVYGYVLGLEPAGATAARGFQYIHLDLQANAYDVIEGYFQQGSLNNSTPDLECSGYNMDDFWGDRHGEWIFEDMNGIMGGDYTVRVWPQDPSTGWSGMVWAISKDDQFLWPSPNPLHNDCGSSPVGLDRGPFNGFSEFGVVSATDFLPIELLYITATPINNQFIRVDWATAKEENVDFFELERSLDGINFQRIATKDAIGGTTSISQYYSHDDYNVLPNVDYYYRVKTVDNDGTFEYTTIVSAAIKKDGAIENVILYPNPISEGSAILEIKSELAKNAEIRIFDAIGQLIYTQPISVIAGLNRISIDTDNLAAGAYFIHLVGQDMSTVKELIKIRR